MAYTPPNGDAVNFDFQGSAVYTPLAGDSLVAEWLAPAAEGVGEISYSPAVNGTGYHHINKGSGVIAYTPTAEGEGYHYLLGNAEAQVSIKIITAFEYLSKTVNASLKITLVSQGTVEGAIEVEVESNAETIEAPISIELKSISIIEAPIVIGVVGDQVRWSAAIYINGVDYSSRVSGVANVEGEEGSARVASFTIIPVDGVISAFAFSGASVVIDYLSDDSGETVAQRLFTGFVDSIKYNPVTRYIDFSCSDDLQNRVANMSRASLDALTGGRIHASVSGEDIVDNWQYVQECMRVVAGSFDAGVYGQLRVSMWDTSTVTKEYTVASVLDETLDVELASRSDILNRVNVGFEFRFSRLRERLKRITWSINPYYWLEQTIPLLAWETVENSLESSGWNIDSASYTPFPEYLYIDEYGNPYIPSGATLSVFMINRILDPENTCMEFNATLRKRFGQTVTETYDIVVRSSESIAKNGTIATDITASISSEWSPSEWESNYDLEPLMPTTFAKEKVMDYHPDVDEAERTAATEILIDISKVDILRSHRTSRVSVGCICDPAVDLNWRVRINAGTVVATGKVAQFIHELNFDEGYATTEIRIAVSGHGSVGITPVTTPTVAPTQPAIPTISTDTSPFGAGLNTYIGGRASSPTYSEDWEGWIVNVRAYTAITNYATTLPTEVKKYNSDGTIIYTPGTAEQNQEGYSGNWPNPEYIAEKAFPETGFRVILPAVEEAARDAYTPVVSSVYEIAIPEDEFVLSA